MVFKKLFNRKNDFKNLSKEIKSEIKIIKAVEDDAERLERYQSLKERIDQLMSNPNIARAVEKPDKDKDGFVAYLTPITLSAAFFMAAMPILYSAPLLAPFFPILVPAAAAIAVVTGIVGRRLIDRSRAREVGLKTADVKFARKMQRQQTKVLIATNALADDKEMEESLKTLRESFTATAATAEKNRKERRLSGVVHHKSASAKNKSAKL
jgi:hypothetical protein